MLQNHKETRLGLLIGSRNQLSRKNQKNTRLG